MHLVRRRVLDAGGPALHPETVLVGFPHPFASPAAEAAVDGILRARGVVEPAAPPAPRGADRG
jgi:hypothetical protein